MDSHFGSIVVDLIISSVGALMAIVGFFVMRFIRSIDTKMNQMDKMREKLILIDDNVNDLHVDIKAIKTAIYARFKA